MEDKLFLGVADNSRFTTAVVGDSLGRIVATDVGGSVNHHRYGVLVARKHLQDLVKRTVGYQGEQNLERICFTFKSDTVTNDLEMARVVQGPLENVEIRVESFLKTCALGMGPCGRQDLLLIIGGQSGSVVLQKPSGLRFQMREELVFWDIQRRLKHRVKNERRLTGYEDVQVLLSQSSHCPKCLIQDLECLARVGNPVALELLYDMAHDVLGMVIRMVRHRWALSPTIGLYGDVLFGSGLILERVRHLIATVFPRARFCEANFAPARGAYLANFINKQPGRRQNATYGCSILT